MEKFCLIIDNEDQTTSIERIAQIAKTKGFDIVCDQFFVGNPEKIELLEDGYINIEKVVTYYKANYKKNHYDLIAFDWDLNDDRIDGVELIRQFQHYNLLRKTPIVLFSGQLTDEIKGYFDAYNKDSRTFQKNWNKIKTLIKVPIIDFFDRTNYEEDIANLLKRLSGNINLENYFISKLRENGGIVFNNINPPFEGKTFSQIAEMVEEESINGHRFTQELIDQTLAYLLKINDH